MEHLIHLERQTEALDARFAHEISDIDLEQYPVGRDFYQLLEQIFRGEAQFEELPFHKTGNGELLNYLYATHDFYLGKKLPEIEQFLFRLKEENDDPLMLVLDDYFSRFHTELVEHILFEERRIFPMLMTRDKSQVAVNQLMDHMDHHGEENEQQLEMILSVLEDRLKHQPESLGFGILLNMLRQFLWDLQIHAKLEDELLIPRLKAVYLGA